MPLKIPGQLTTSGEMKYLKNEQKGTSFTGLVFLAQDDLF
jgi:hypothetical protein